MPTWTDNYSNLYRADGSVLVFVTYFNRRRMSAFLNTTQVPGNFTAAFSDQPANGYLPSKQQVAFARSRGVSREFHLAFSRLAVEGNEVTAWRQLDQRVSSFSYNDRRDCRSIATPSFRALLI